MVSSYQDQSLTPSNYAVFRWFGFDQFVPEHAVTSHWVSSKTFLIIRSILTLYSTVVLWTDIGTSGGIFFQYFTSMTFIGLHAYQITSLVHHIRYLYTKDISFFVNQPTVLNYLYVYLYSTVVTFNIVTPVVFWAILAKAMAAKTTIGVWMNVSVHGVSFFLMIFDVIFNRMKLSIRMAIFPLLTIIFYMLLAFIIYAVNHRWVYPFLDWYQGPSAAIWYFAVGIICVVAFFIQVLIHWLRDFVARKTGKMNSVEITDDKDNDIAITKLEVDNASSNA
ncbi:uncharacterized protein ATC70_003308 [Mucor velutinosus]|uniref:Uncharacterized protein n=1 Tax=Mucor velutinosus TaxID=708070 RepID=A0AAN7DBF6_9FUNG|nr:hypothetical protein ATC70_003308 [Mucor velutinosus]